ncbi:hypothetical protein [Terasakiella sp.]|uniref:hypothetical protein n=1 Tax=Terasakiella sp. TaxID=2034861 RepID=UPI003AA807CB
MMKKQVFCLAAAGCFLATVAHADPAYDKKLGEYMVHLQEMQAEADRMKGLVVQFDKTSQACLDELQAGKPAKICIVMQKDKMDFVYEHKKFRSYNRIRKVPKFERALQDMMQMEMFSLPKEDANYLFKTHMDAKDNRQQRITAIGEQIYGAIDRFNAISDERLTKIKELKKKK